MLRYGWRSSQWRGWGGGCAVNVVSAVPAGLMPYLCATVLASQGVVGFDSALVMKRTLVHTFECGAEMHYSTTRIEECGFAGFPNFLHVRWCSVTALSLSCGMPHAPLTTPGHAWHFAATDAVQR